MTVSTPDQTEEARGDDAGRARRVSGALRRLHARYASCDEGRIADYIPELTKADRDWFGIAIVTVEGEVFSVGDDEQPFTIQSLSKPLRTGSLATP